MKDDEGAGPDAGSWLLWAVLLFCVGLSALVMITEPDTGWYLRCGTYILATRSLPLHDPFSYTSTVPWINHEWLAEVLLAAAARAGQVGRGTFGDLWVVGALQAVVFALTIGIVGCSAGLGRGRSATLGLAPLLLAFGAGYLREWVAPRAQLFSNLLFAVTLYLVLREWRTPFPRSPDGGLEPAGGRPGSGPYQRHALWWIAPIAVLWTQLHGGTPYCLSLVGLLFLSRPSKALLALCLVVAAASVVGPYGWRVLDLYAGMGAWRSEVREWSSLPHALGAGGTRHLGIVVLLLLGALAIVRRHRRGEPVRFDALLLLTFGLTTVLHVRMAPLAGLVSLAVALPWVAGLVGAWRQKWAGGGVVLLGALCVAILAGAVLTSSRQMGVGFARGRVPVAAVEALRRARPPGPMFNSYNFGGYLLWAYPEEKVFIDGRAMTAYSVATIDRLMAIYAHPEEFAGVVRDYGVRLAVLQRQGRGAGLLAWLRQQPEWHVAYEDELATVLERRDPAAGDAP